MGQAGSRLSLRRARCGAEPACVSNPQGSSEEGSEEDEDEEDEDEEGECMAWRVQFGFTGLWARFLV